MKTHSERVLAKVEGKVPTDFEKISVKEPMHMGFRYIIYNTF